MACLQQEKIVGVTQFIGFIAPSVKKYSKFQGNQKMTYVNYGIVTIGQIQNLMNQGDE